MKVIAAALLVLLVQACGHPSEPSPPAHVVPAGLLPFGYCRSNPPELGQTCGLEERAWGCDDLEPFELQPGQCLRIADELWGTIEDDIACWSLGDVCSRECAGFLEIKNDGPEPMLVRARSKLGRVKTDCAGMDPGMRYAGGPNAGSWPPPGTSY